MLGWALRLMARDRCYIVDAEGRERDLTTALLARWSWQLLREVLGKKGLLRQVTREVQQAEHIARARRTPSWNRSAIPLYLRTDLSFGVRAGGSVGHIAGVLNELASSGPPMLMTTAPVPTVRPDVEVHHVAVPERFWNFSELPTFVLNSVFVDETLRAVGDRPISFVYQRYSLNNYAGLRLAQRLEVPFVLEYNGSEIWMSRHWGRRLKYEDIAGADRAAQPQRRRSDRRRQRRDARRARRSARRRRRGCSSIPMPWTLLDTHPISTAASFAADWGSRTAPSLASSRRFSPGTAPSFWRGRLRRCSSGILSTDAPSACS